jgi:hypothetical protein
LVQLNHHQAKYKTVPVHSANTHTVGSHIVLKLVFHLSCKFWWQCLQLLIFIGYVYSYVHFHWFVVFYIKCCLFQSAPCRMVLENIILLCPPTFHRPRVSQAPLPDPQVNCTVCLIFSYVLLLLFALTSRFYCARLHDSQLMCICIWCVHSFEWLKVVWCCPEVTWYNSKLSTCWLWILYC